MFTRWLLDALLTVSSPPPLTDTWTGIITAS